MANSLNLFAEWVDNGECPVPGISIDEYLLVNPLIDSIYEAKTEKTA